MASYKDRLRGDLDRWIGEGLVPTASRQPMLDSIADSRRPDAVSALAMVGVLLAGAAIIAFVAANWDGIPRFARFGLLVAAFLAACAGGAWANWKQRPNMGNGLITLAALIFAASIGLTGQIFDLAGDPKTALMSAGAAAALLALAGRASGAAVAALALIGLGDLSPHGTWWLLPTAVIGAGLAWLWRSRPTAHAAAIGLGLGVGLALWRWGAAHPTLSLAGLMLAASGLLALAALAARALAARDRPEAGVVYGWLTWAALTYFLLSSLDLREGGALLIAHRVAWLILAGGVLALGRIDRQGAVMAAGVVALIAGVIIPMLDLGVDLATASVIFAVAAILVLTVVGLVRGRRPR
jgi:hypothetical protein